MRADGPLSLFALLLALTGCADPYPVQAPARLTGPAPLFDRPLLDGAMDVLGPNQSAQVLHSGTVVLEAPPGRVGIHPVRRMVERLAVKLPDGRVRFASPQLGLRATGAPEDPWTFTTTTPIRWPLIDAGIALLGLAALFALLAWQRRRWRHGLATLAFTAAGLALISGGAFGYFVTYGGDESLYSHWSKHIATGQTLRPNGFGIGWPLMLSALVRLLNIPANPVEASWILVPIVGPIVAAATATLVAAVARRVFRSSARGLVAGFGWLTWAMFIRHPHIGWPPAPIFEGRSVLALPGWTQLQLGWDLDIYFWAIRSGWSLLSDAPATCFLLGGLLAGLAARESGKARTWVLSGALTGWALTIRPASGVALVPWLVLGLFTLRGGLKPALLASGGALLGYLPQAFMVFKWTGSPFQTVFVLNRYHQQQGEPDLFQLSRFFEQGIGFYGVFAGTLLFATSAALFWPARQRETARESLALALGVIVSFGAMGSFAYGTHMPERFVLPAMAWLFIGLSGFGAGQGFSPRSLQVTGVLLALTLLLVPGMPMPEQLRFPLPLWFYALTPLLMGGWTLALYRRLETPLALTLLAAVGTITINGAAYPVAFAAPLLVVGAAAWSLRRDERDAKSAR